MAQDPHTTVPPVGSLDRVPFLNAARRRLEEMLPNLTEPPSGVPPINYLEPAGDPGIFGPDSVTWRVLSNPASVFIGGITAVIFELAEPACAPGCGTTRTFAAIRPGGCCKRGWPRWLSRTVQCATSKR